MKFQFTPGSIVSSSYNISIFLLTNPFPQLFWELIFVFGFLYRIYKKLLPFFKTKILCDQNESFLLYVVLGQLFISLSCALAVFCNLSQYICIGRFSAVSFQVLGHMKTVCVLLLGWMFFDSTLNFKNIMGMLMAVLGMVLYSSAMEASKQVPPKTPLPLLKGMSFVSDDEDVSLLKGGFGSQDIEGGKENLK